MDDIKLLKDIDDGDYSDYWVKLYNIYR
jgi:hypothetical protein